MVPAMTASWQIPVDEIAAGTVISANGNSGDLSIAGADEVVLLVNISAQAGTSPGIQLILELKGPDGIYYPIYTGTSITATGAQAPVFIGPGLPTNVILATDLCRLRWVIAGTSSPSVTASVSLMARASSRSPR